MARLAVTMSMAVAAAVFGSACLWWFQARFSWAGRCVFLLSALVVAVAVTVAALDCGDTVFDQQCAAMQSSTQTRISHSVPM